MVFRDWKVANMVWNKFLQRLVTIDFGLCQLKDVSPEGYVAAMTAGEY